MSGNFVEIAQSQINATVGFGKMMILYSTEKDIAASALTATAINAERAAGTIKGIIQGWNTVTGASVAEKTIERATSEIHVIKPEILADNMTFDDTVENQDVFKRLSGNTFNVIFLDDRGNAFGEESLVPSSIKTMRVNFSSKVSNGFQHDQTNEKTISIVARYLVNKIGWMYAGTEVEEVISKTALIGKVSSFTTHTTSSIVMVMDLINAKTGELLTTFVTTALDVNVSVNGITVTGSGTFANNQLTLTLSKTVADFTTTTDIIRLKLSTELYYMTEIKIKMADLLS